VGDDGEEVQPSARDVELDDVGGGPPHRLRDLRGRDLVFVLATAGLVMVPFVVALVRSWHDGWLPSGDEANIAVRSLDVFSRHPPLTGLPSTSYLYGRAIFTNHPGPFEFYLISVPLRLFGPRAGMLLTAASINASAVLITLWVVYRRAGVLVMLWAGVVMQAVIWSAGTAVLADTLSSNMPMYSLICTAVLVWALIDGDIRLLPLTALVGSYAAQQHLAATSLVVVLTVVGLVLIAARVVRRTRAGDATIARTSRRWVLLAMGVAFLCWLPVIVDQVSGHPGNISAIVEMARDAKRPTVGLQSGITQALRAITPSTLLGRTDTTGLNMIEHLRPGDSLVGAAIVFLLVGVGVVARRKRAALYHRVVITLVILVAGAINGANVPLGIESGRINLYRWTWTAAFLTWTALGWGIALLVVPAFARSSAARRTRSLAPAVLLLTAALIATTTATISGQDDHNGQLPAYAIEPRLAKIVLQEVDRHHPVLVAIDGCCESSIGSYIVFRLLRAGVPIEATPLFVHFYGSHRRYRPGPHTSALVISSSTAPLPPTPGRVIVDEVFDPEYSALADDLTTAAKRAPIQLAPNAAAIIKRDYPNPKTRASINLALQYFDTNVRGIVTNPNFLRLVLDGAITSPHFDLAKVQRLLDLAPHHKTMFGNERLRIALVAPDQISAATVPGL
jgi:hypothetical protein